MRSRPIHLSVANRLVYAPHSYKWFADVAHVGSASVPIALADADKQGLLSDGDLVLAGFGDGVSVGACLVRWRPIGVGALPLLAAVAS